MKLSQLTIISISAVLISCGNKSKKEDPVAKALQQQRKDMQELQRIQKAEKAEADAEAARREARQAKVDAPISIGEFKLVISPDPSIKDMFVVPVHVFTMSSAQADKYRSMNAADYWRSPQASARKTNFGTSGVSGVFTASIPFKNGDDAVIVITKLPGANQPIYVQNLVRPKNLSKPAAIKIRVTSSGLLPQ